MTAFDAARQIDLRARRGLVTLLLIGNALLADDLPQDVGIGSRRRNPEAGPGCQRQAGATDHRGAWAPRRGRHGFGAHRVARLRNEVGRRDLTAMPIDCDRALAPSSRSRRPWKIPTPVTRAAIWIPAWAGLPPGARRRSGCRSACRDISSPDRSIDRAGNRGGGALAIRVHGSGRAGDCAARSPAPGLPWS